MGYSLLDQLAMLPDHERAQALVSPRIAEAVTNRPWWAACRPEQKAPEGDWTVTFALPGDFITETWRIVLTCPKGACDAVVEIRDAKGKARGRGELALRAGCPPLVGKPARSAGSTPD